MPTRRAVWGSAFALCCALAIVHTWPLATAPGTLSRNDNGDAQLNEWILAWIAHQLPRDPTRLFQGNIFHPAPDTLAFSEPLIVPALLGAPLAWLGASPVLVYNAMLIAGFALTAFAGFALVFRWTGDRAAALVSGSLLAFNTHTLTRLAHVQGLHLYGLPLALLSTDRLLTHARTRDALTLAFWMTVMAYTSGYLVVFATVMIAVVLLTRLPEWRRQPQRIVKGFAIATAVSGLAILPLMIPYLRVARDQHMVRTVDSVGEYSATLKGYLAAAGTIHFSTWSGAFFRDPVDSFFPGFTAIALCVAACWFAFRRDAADSRRRSLVVMLLAIATVGVVLSLGTQTPVYGWLYAFFPPMRGLRAAARFGNLFLLGLAVLAGLGLAAARQRTPRPRWRLAVTIAAVAAVNLEALRAPFEYRRFAGIPAVYGLLADEPGRVVLVEVPFYPRQAVFENAEYVLNSTAHWRPLMNGYSGYTPDSYVAVAEAFWHFPDERAIGAMRSAGVTHVMVHPSRFGNEAEAMLRTVSGRLDFELVAVGRAGIRLYRMR